jgi:NIMA-interacting peptidyl-prolyl cis-trans isomerase 1
MAFAIACDKPEPAPTTVPSAKTAPSAVAPNPAEPAAKPAAPSSAVARVEPSSVAIQHVLLAYRGAKGAPKTVKRSQPEAKRLAEEVLAKARAGGDFSQLASKYSDDPGTKGNRGNLGKRTRAVLVPPFADAAFRLEEGQISDVVETEFGFHIIKRNQ